MKRAAVDEEAASRLQRIMERMHQINSTNCYTRKAYELFLPGDVNFGKRYFRAACPLSPQRGAANAEIKVPSGEDTRA